MGFENLSPCGQKDVRAAERRAPSDGYSYSCSHPAAVLQRRNKRDGDRGSKWNGDRLSARTSRRSPRSAPASPDSSRRAAPVFRDGNLEVNASANAASKAAAKAAANTSRPPTAELAEYFTDLQHEVVLPQQHVHCVQDPQVGLVTLDELRRLLHLSVDAVQRVGGSVDVCKPLLTRLKQIVNVFLRHADVV